MRPPAGPGPATALADRLLPVFDFAETHGRSGVRAVPSAVVDAVARYDDAADPLLRTALQLREAPARLARRIGLGGGIAPGTRRFGLHSFTELERTEDHIALGLTGRFWAGDFGLAPCADLAQFQAFDAPGSARLLLCFATQPASAAGTLRIETVTRIQCTDDAARRRMRLYWMLIRPVSGLIRRRILRRLQHSAEDPIAAC